ncbi:MAG TPA: hypothetical protein VGE21_17195 [Flavobacteriales bacterium]
MRCLRQILCLVAVLSASTLSAQRPELNTQAAVDQHVSDALAADKASGELAELARKLGLRGSFTFDLTVGDKGRTVTVFPIESTIENVEHRNRLKDQLLATGFPFKLNKKKRFKTRQTLVFP